MTWIRNKLMLAIIWCIKYVHGFMSCMHIMFIPLCCLLFCLLFVHFLLFIFFHIIINSQQLKQPLYNSVPAFNIGKILRIQLLFPTQPESLIVVVFTEFLFENELLSTFAPKIAGKHRTTCEFWPRKSWFLAINAHGKRLCKSDNRLGKNYFAKWSKSISSFYSTLHVSIYCYADSPQKLINFAVP